MWFTSLSYLCAWNVIAVLSGRVVWFWQHPCTYDQCTRTARGLCGIVSLWPIRPIVLLGISRLAPSRPTSPTVTTTSVRRLPWYRRRLSQSTMEHYTQHRQHLSLWMTSLTKFTRHLQAIDSSFHPVHAEFFLSFNTFMDFVLSNGALHAASAASEPFII
jgi:hypothetical protein